MERTTVRLPDDLLEQAKARARRTGRTFTQLLEEALRAELARQTAVGRVAVRSSTYETHSTDIDHDQSNVETTAPTAVQRERSTKQLLEQVRDLQSFLSALPDLDPRSAEEILGYNAHGLPE